MAIIIDGQAFFRQDLASWVQSYAQPHVADRFGETIPPLTSVAGIDPIPAIVNAGRWVVQCPDCYGATFAWKTAHQFCCLNCYNASACPGQWRPVVWPSDATVTAIEAALTVRPARWQRNWDPTQTVADLIAENDAMNWK